MVKMLTSAGPLRPGAPPATKRRSEQQSTEQQSTDRLSRLAEASAPVVPTLRQVAQASGVSTSTVSRYLRGQLAVSAETQRGIDDAVESLNYVPLTRRRPAAKLQQNVFGLVLPGLSNAFFAALADAIADEVALLGGSLVLCTTRDVRRREEAYTELLEAKSVDGMLYLGAHASNRRLAAVIRRGLPVVVVDEPQTKLPPVTTLTVDNFTGAFHGTTYLLGMGHRRIAYIGGPSTLATEKERRRGYEEALQRNGLVPSEELIIGGAYSRRFGAAALPHLLRMEPMPTAVFCASDESALGLMSAARTFGLALPDDLSILGFDDTIPARYTTPPLSSIHQPVTDIAKNAVEMLAARIDNPSAKPETRTLPVELVVRESVARHDAN